MAKKTAFLRQFWREKKMIGAMSPSSKYLAHKMLENIDFKNATVIIELGPGTGVFTKKILEFMRPDAKLLVFELNDTFFSQLKEEITDARMHLIHDSAEFIEKYLNEAGFSNADYIISSLPLAVFPVKVKTNIINASYETLKNHGKYIQFQYSLNSKKILKAHFDEVHLAFTPFNFPPAFVYTCIKNHD